MVGAFEAGNLADQTYELEVMWLQQPESISQAMERGAERAVAEDWVPVWARTWKTKAPRSAGKSVDKDGEEEARISLFKI